MIDFQNLFKVLLSLSTARFFVPKISIPTPSHFFPKQILKTPATFFIPSLLEKLSTPLQEVMLQSPIGLKPNTNASYD